MSTKPTDELRVTAVVEITHRGLALFFERDPDPVPEQRRLQVRIVRPDGTAIYTEVCREFARKVPPGEVLAFLAPALRQLDVPLDSRVSIIEGRDG